MRTDGRGRINHDRLGPFHRTLSGHSMNYMTRGTYWGIEQCQQTQAPMVVGPGSSPQKYRNTCGIGGEDCSLCMVSSVAPAYWIRWMLVGESANEDIAYLARGAPRRCVTTAPVWHITGADALWTGDVHYAGAREITESQSSTSTSRLRGIFWCALCSSYS